MKHLATIGILLSLLAGSTRSWAQCDIPAPTSPPHYPATLIDEMTGQPLSSSATKCIVLIHGWNPSDANNCYSGEFASLLTNLKAKLAGTGWSIVAYDWHQDASTGYVGQWNNGIFQFVFGAANQAAANAQPHGDRLVTMLDNAAADLREVHFIAHSAGTHAAKEAMIRLLQLNPYVIVQATFLDPYIPCPADSLGAFSDEAMDELQFATGNDRVMRLENYFADDSYDYNINKATWPTENTQETFFWRANIDINQKVDWGNPITTGEIYPPQYLPNYNWHAGPIQFYADTVDASIPGHTPSSSLPTGSPYDYRQIGWNRSLYAWEAYLPQITTQPADQTVQSGGTMTLTVAANRADSIDWYVFGGNWVGSGPTLTMNNFTAANYRLYVARVGNINGQIYSRPALITVGAPAAPSVTTVSPFAFTGLPIGQRTPIHIIGSGFTSSSTLVFNDGFQNYNSNPAQLTFLNGNEIDYGISTGTNQANWTVQIVNGAQTSGLGRFTVNAPSSSPTATGSLVVNLSPAGAISAGAQWQVDGTGYNSSGQVVGYMAPGPHTVSFKPVSGYSTPSSQIVNIFANQVTTNSASYTVIAPSTYSLALNYNNAQGGASPSPAAGGNIYAAGSVVQLYASASSGYHFTGWSGDASGTANPITVTMNGNKNITANFASGDPNLGTLTVTIQPPAAATAGVTWGFNANDYRTSGSSYTTFPASYFINLHPVAGWLGPTLQLMTIAAGQTTNVTVTFTPDTTPGLLTVTLSPPDAAAAGAQWHANGAAYGNGGSASLPPGNYTITFDTVAGWSAPASQNVTIQRAQTTVASGNYTPPAGQPSIVSIQPGVGVLAGGTRLTIQGLNFTTPATVLVGGQPATNISVVSDSQITCFTPSNSVYGTSPVVVQTTSGNVTNLNGFAYGFPRGNGVQLVGSIGGYINAIAVQGNYCYTAEGSTFTILDVSNPSAPSPVGRLAMPGQVGDIALFTVSGHQYAAVADGDAGLQIVDVTTPTTPTLRGYYNTGDWAGGIAVLGSSAYVANGNSGFSVLDISNPTRPQLMGSLGGIGYSDRLVVQASGSNILAYISAGGGVAVVDASVKSSPILKGQTSAITEWYEPHSLAISGNRAFLADGYDYMQAIDISNPSSPTPLGSVAFDSPSAVTTANGLVYTWSGLDLTIYNLVGGNLQTVGFVANSSPFQGDTIAILGGSAICSGGQHGLFVYDVSAPSSPAYRGAFGATAGYYISAAINGNNGFFATQNSGLKVFDVSNSGNPTLLSQFVPWMGNASKVKVSGNRAFLLGAGQINVLDVSNPTSTPGSFGHEFTEPLFCFRLLLAWKFDCRSRVRHNF